jgi:serine/threonine-protein kinase HipA
MKSQSSPATKNGSVKLVALLDGRKVGNVHQSSNGRLGFEYYEPWRTKAGAYPISLSMPLTAREHAHEAISAFLWGLLPDNGQTLDHYGRLFGVSAGNPVALLARIGADCAGAIQLISPDQVHRMLGIAPAKPTVDWITEAEIAAELRTVRMEGIPGRTRRTAGQFSLAGAQPKIALLEENGRWGRPLGRTPTNRILKPPSREFRGFAENEHLCLDIAYELGLGVVNSEVRRFGDEVAIVVERFDRIKKRGRYHRVHQEDVCQALSVLPTRKYENEGGPGIQAVLSLIREASQAPEDDSGRFIDAMSLNWVLASTDGHAKNYALLHGSGGVRLAPFYDIASYLPYSDERLYRVKLAMRVGGEYQVRNIRRRHWEKLATENRLSIDYVLDRIARILDALPKAVEVVTARSIREGLEPSIIHPFEKQLQRRIPYCQTLLGRG